MCSLIHDTSLLLLVLAVVLVLLCVDLTRNCPRLKNLLIYFSSDSVTLTYDLSVVPVPGSENIIS